MKMGVNFYCLSLLFVTACSFASDANVGNAHIAKVLDSSFRADSSMRLPASRIEFKEAVADGDKSGFFSDSEVVAKGKVRTQLIDYKKNTTSKKLFDAMIHSLSQSHYELLFQCTGESCGKKDGYRLYLSKRLNDVSASQSYVIASRNNTYKAFYVADIDGQPRGYLVDVTVPVVKQAVADTNLIPFSSGSAELSDASQHIIDHWLAGVPKATKTISLLGHADAPGGLEQNAQLAEARTLAVKTYIANKLGSAGPRIFSLSAANLARPLHASRGRYVELMAHMTE